MLLVYPLLAANFAAISSAMLIGPAGFGGGGGAPAAPP